MVTVGYRALTQSLYPSSYIIRCNRSIILWFVWSLSPFDLWAWGAARKRELCPSMHYLASAYGTRNDSLLHNILFGIPPARLQFYTAAMAEIAFFVLPGHRQTEPSQTINDRGNVLVPSIHNIEWSYEVHRNRFGRSTWIQQMSQRVAGLTSAKGFTDLETPPFVHDIPIKKFIGSSVDTVSKSFANHNALCGHLAKSYQPSSYEHVLLVDLMSHVDVSIRQCICNRMFSARYMLERKLGTHIPIP